VNVTFDLSDTLASDMLTSLTCQGLETGEIGISNHVTYHGRDDCLSVFVVVIVTIKSPTWLPGESGLAY
jgi:hypothetical protein